MEDLLEANRIMLDEQGRRIDGSVDRATHLVGAVVVEAGAEITESVLRGPVVIGRSAIVARSTLGPHVSVYDGSRIEDSEISNSIIMGWSDDLRDAAHERLADRDGTWRSRRVIGIRPRSDS